MARRTWVTLGFMLVVVSGLIAALLFEATSNPTFRPEDYASFQECIDNIPREWAPGSLDQSGAEASCYYVHKR
jgi:hypothetical protein